MPSEHSITIIVPAYNEEPNIAAAIDSVINACEGCVNDYEIIVVNDGSYDGTADIAEKRALTDPRIRILHNEKNRGYGYCYQKGVQQASKEYIGVFPGDNDMAWESLKTIIQNIDEADLITSFTQNMKDRPWIRRVISRMFTRMMNSLFKMNLKYFNGSFICRKSRLQTITIKATSLIVIAECLVRLINNGATYKEIGITHIGRKHESSKALYPRSIVAVLHDVLVLKKEMQGQCSSNVDDKAH